MATGEASHSCLKEHSAKESGAVLNDCSFTMEMLFPLHRSKKEESGKVGEREAKKGGSVLKHREQGEIKTGVGGNIVIFYRISGYGNSFSLLFILP